MASFRSHRAVTGPEFASLLPISSNSLHPAEEALRLADKRAIGNCRLTQLDFDRVRR